MTRSVVLTRKQWAERLNGEWRGLRDATVAAFIQLGRSLLEAKEQLPHGEFIPMVHEDLEMNRNTANIFMRIAGSEMVGNAHHLLPPDYTTIDKLTRLAAPTLKRLIKDGTINPQLKRNEVAKNSAPRSHLSRSAAPAPWCR